MSLYYMSMSQINCRKGYRLCGRGLLKAHRLPCSANLCFSYFCQHLNLSCQSTMLISPLFLVIIFLVPLNASPFRSNPNVVCREEAGIRLRNIDCDRLLEHLHFVRWLQQRLVWGIGQPWPGDVPRSYTINSCTLKLLATHPERKETETFALSDFWSNIILVYDICLGYRRSAGGKIVIGKEEKFFAYLGDPMYESNVSSSQP